MHNIVEWMFSLGLLINAILFIPQALTLYRHKQGNELSLATFAGFNVTQLLTIGHGYFAHDYRLMVGIFCSLVTSGLVTWLIIYYRLIKSRHKI